MTASEAKFDGCVGSWCPDLDWSIPGNGKARYKPLRTKTKYPSNCPDRNFKEQLIWLYHENTEPTLYWCNEDDQWFELHFQPVDKP
jgi:hypothetical protein